MKVLVATSRTQGARPGDHHYCIDGELVWIQEHCGRGRKRRPDSCGCGRAFAGCASHRATTIAEVADIEGLTLEDYAAALRISMVDGGWPAEWAEPVAEAQAEFTARFQVGTVLERDLEEFSQRILVL
jgi:hypothetical protein